MNTTPNNKIHGFEFSTARHFTGHFNRQSAMHKAIMAIPSETCRRSDWQRRSGISPTFWSSTRQHRKRPCVACWIDALHCADKCRFERFNLDFHADSLTDFVELRWSLESGIHVVTTRREAVCSREKRKPSRHCQQSSMESDAS